MEERFELIRNRIMEIQYEKSAKEPFRQYFEEVASFLILILSKAEENKDKDLISYVREELPRKSVEELLRENHAFYEKLAEANYETSYLNPQFAVETLGKDYGGLLSFLYAEFFSMIPYCYEIMYDGAGSLEQLVIRAELFVEIYLCFCGGTDNPKEILYWFVSDYAQPLMERRVEEKVNPKVCFAAEIIKYADLSTPHYLFAFGEYIHKNQIKTAEYLAKQGQEKIDLMASTYTEGYRIGFVKGNKDLSKKKIVQIVYPLGFERMIKKAVANFYEMGLEPVIPSHSRSIFHKRGLAIGGYYSDSPNRQFDFDHREDEALFLDKKLMNRKLEIVRESYEHRKEQAADYAGPAWVEIFGEKEFRPVMKSQCCRLSEKQQEWATAYYSQQGRIINEYIKGEERSFTIIAFPVPEIGDDYEAIMDETIQLNTLDYQVYEQLQQRMIDTLDEAEYVEVQGRNGNETNIKVMLCKLNNPQKETKFENCVADVNIPVGEIFTSPVLEGTNGVLHVSSVFLNGLEFRNLKLTFKDGRIVDYSCDNFDTREKNSDYIKEHILFHHKTLPLGEFAVGTNTTAYVMGRRYGISDKLPILIAEKTGPHFAVGDTCYSHAEEIKVYNTDGKEIVARDNEISILRKTDMEKAYFQCHTDITIPYDELGALYGVTREGGKLSIIEDGRFVLEGTEVLNVPFNLLDCFPSAVSENPRHGSKNLVN